MNYFLYFQPFLTAFLLGVFLLPICIFFGKKIHNKRLSGRHIHNKEISRLGGVSIIITFCASLILDPNLIISVPLKGIIVASILILIIGIVDDIRELDWKIQFFFQVVIAMLVFVAGARVEYLTNPWGGVFDMNMDRFFLPSLLFGLFWIMLFINSMNWIDGVDGVSGGITLIGGIAIFLLSLKPEVNQPPVAIISAVLVGSILAFLIFNFHPSKILAGTSGSMFMGFILAILSIFAGAKTATALLVMAIPITDACWVAWERIKSGQSVFEADRRHLHHKLLELGWGQRKIAGFFSLITALVAIVALNTETIGKLVAIGLVGGLMVGVLCFINKKLILLRNDSIKNGKK